MLVLAIVAVLEALVILTLAVRLTRAKYDGNVVVHETDDKKTFSIEINGDPDKLDQKKEIRLRVRTLPE